MNTTAMQAGRDRAAKQRQQQWAKQQEAFMAWCRAEANAYAGAHWAEDIYGTDSDEYRVAYKLWKRTLGAMPTPPPDHGWVN